jgi:hypothetical protein
MTTKEMLDEDQELGGTLDNQEEEETQDYSEETEDQEDHDD